VKAIAKIRERNRILIVRKKISDKEVLDECHRIRGLSDPPARAEAFMRLTWRCHRLPQHADVAFGFSTSGAHRQTTKDQNTGLGYYYGNRMISAYSIWYETADPIERELWEAYWGLLAEYTPQRRWWREKNLSVELAKRRGFFTELVGLFERTR